MGELIEFSDRIKSKKMAGKKEKAGSNFIKFIIYSQEIPAFIKIMHDESFHSLLDKNIDELKEYSIKRTDETFEELDIKKEDQEDIIITYHIMEIMPIIQAITNQICFLDHEMIYPAENILERMIDLGAMYAKSIEEYQLRYTSEKRLKKFLSDYKEFIKEQEAEETEE